MLHSRKSTLRRSLLSSCFRVSLSADSSASVSTARSTALSDSTSPTIACVPDIDFILELRGKAVPVSTGTRSGSDDITSGVTKGPL